MDKIEEVLTRGVAKIFPTKQALEKILLSGRKIRLYQGFDPSMPNLHLGNMVGVLKLRQFQDLGHEVIFLVGDFTGMIGDPTDKSSTRPKLTREQVRKNCQNWQKQAGKVLRFSGKNPAKFLFNSDWLDKITFKELIEITSNFTVQQMIARDFFQKRLKEKRPIFLHEFLYPVAQATDSVKMDVDLEIGGDDQTFNMLCGRTLIKVLKNKEKYILSTKLLVDKLGNKVGKTTGNALFLNASPADLYGGIMSFPDEVISLAFELLTLIPLHLIKEAVKAQPMEAKKQLAFEIVKIHHSEKAAFAAQKEFERTFQKRQAPTSIPVFQTTKKKIGLADLLTESKMASSKSEAKRLILQGAVEIGESIVRDPQVFVELKQRLIIRAGKRKFIRINLKK